MNNIPVLSTLFVGIDVCTQKNVFLAMYLNSNVLLESDISNFLSTDIELVSTSILR